MAITCQITALLSNGHVAIPYMHVKLKSIDTELNYEGWADLAKKNLRVVPASLTET
jgi:hypothetical protein